jgi:putative oxidoreductase
MGRVFRWWRRFWGPERHALGVDLALLVLRISVGLMMAWSHGLGKMKKLMAGGELKFADPLGIGMGPSLFLAGTTEFFASLALVIGVGTRLLSVPLAFTMVVAVFIVHADDPFKKQEFGLLYLTAYAVLMLAGPGRFSVDAWLTRRFNRE